VAWESAYSPSLPLAAVVNPLPS
jgi:hypothetical protein